MQGWEQNAGGTHSTRQGASRASTCRVTRTASIFLAAVQKCHHITAIRTALLHCFQCLCGVEFAFIEILHISSYTSSEFVKSSPYVCHKGTCDNLRSHALSCSSFLDDHQMQLIKKQSQHLQQGVLTLYQRQRLLVTVNADYAGQFCRDMHDCSSSHSTHAHHPKSNTQTAV